MLFNPAREMLKKRQDKVKNDIDSAEKSREDAAKLKEEYENRLREIHKEEDAILSAARQKALENETKIIDQAKAEAANIIERANHQAELEMKKAQDEIKKEIITVASMVAGKAVSEKLDIEIQDSLIDDTLKEIGEKNMDKASNPEPMGMRCLSLPWRRTGWMSCQKKFRC